MRVLINGYIGKKITGIGRTLIETLNELALIDDEVDYIVYTNKDNYELLNHNFPSRITVKSYSITKLSSVNNLLFNAFVFPFISLFERADVVYIPNFTIILFSFKPIVSVVHDMIDFKVNEKFSKLRMLYRHMIVPRMAKMSCRIITVSESSKKDIIEICGTRNDKIEVIYDAVSNCFNADNIEERLIDNDYILYVGTVDHPGKNVFNALKAFERYKKNNSNDIKFVICGMPGNGFEKVENFINNSEFHDDIIYRGFVDDSELLNYYAYASVFVFVSFYEGFGMPILEAMKFGIPVITSNRSSLPEVAGNAALICNPDDVEDIAQAYNKLLTDNSLRLDMIEKGYKNLIRFSWRDTAKKTLDIFKLTVCRK